MDRGISDFAPPTGDGGHLDLKVMSVEYTDNKHGTVVHVFGRDRTGKRHHVEVEGHYPSFYIREEAYNKRIDNHYAVHKTERCGPDGERYKNLHGEPLVRVYTYQPEQVGNMRDLFDEHWEADVLYHKRWLIDSGIYTGMRVSLDSAVKGQPWMKGDIRVSDDAVEPLSRDETPRVEPKQVVLDIEVAGEGGVPDENKAEYPVSTIVAWDTENQDYVGWLLLHGDHDRSAVSEEQRRIQALDIDPESGLDELRVFEDESGMLHDFNQWLSHQSPDIITGWWSNDFDLPYLVNRSRRLNTYNYQDWSPLGEVFISKYEPVVKGVACVDMLGAYQKTQIHKLTSKKLDHIAEKEGVGGKEVVEEDHTEMWKNDPIGFLRYNMVDVKLVHGVDQAVGAIDLLDNLRSVVGCSYTDPIGGNIDMMDMMFLRKAQEYGYALPTAEKPEVGYYHGAYVFMPEAGLHTDVIYPDYSSLYPNVMYQCNISPETLVGTEEDLEESKYTEEDCVWTYVDMTTPPSMKEDQEAREEDMERLFFVKPSVEESFVRSVLDDIMGLASEYTGGMYEAVKRVRNSAYGVMGDSDSYKRGFRLFDWRLAEGITLGGQKVLKEGADKFVEYVDDPDARVIYGDTDSFVTTFPNADSAEDALEQSMDAAEHLNDYLDEYAAEEFGLDSKDDAKMEIEIEAFSHAIFFKGQDEGKSDTGVKKRYVQMEAWNDEDAWMDEPELTIKGFEYVRSDVAQVTKDVQYFTFEKLMEENEGAEETVKEHVEKVITEIMEGDYDMGDVGIPFGISQSLTEYGSSERLPQPQYKGAKYANKFIYEGNAITPGDKPLYYYIEEGKTGDGMRKTYRAHTKEDGTYVNCVSVLDYGDMPDGVQIDRPKMIQKTIIDPMEAIFRTLGWGTEWMYDAVEEATPPEYHREEGQMGFEDLI